MIQHGLESWSSGHCKIENPKFRKIRPYLIVYRKSGLDWIRLDVGEHSSCSTWFGTAWEKSVIGSRFDHDPNSLHSDNFLLDAYESVMQNGSLRFDHISTHLLRTGSSGLLPIDYQRLVMSLLFPDGSQAVGTLTARTKTIQIEGLQSELMEQMPQSVLMEFEL